MDVTYIGHIERGQRNLTWTTLNMLCDGLGVKRSELVGRVEEIERAP